MSRPLSRSAIEARDWQRYMATNPKASLGGSQLGRIEERRSVRRTRPLSWAHLAWIRMPGGVTRIVGTMYRTEKEARSQQEKGDGSGVQYRGNRRDRSRTALRDGAR